VGTRLVILQAAVEIELPILPRKRYSCLAHIYHHGLCHSQGQPLKNPIGGKYYDWPVGFHVGLNLSDC